MVNRFTVLIVAALLGAVVLALMASSANGPVTLSRTRRFARRQELLVTTSNGPLVVRALAVTHRWRVLGLTTGLLLGLLWALRDARLNLNFTAAFLGWFVGAVVAEWRLSGLPVEGGRRSASLARRTIWGYLRADSAALLVLTCVALVGLFAAVTVRSDGDERVLLEAGGWLLVAVVGLGAVAATLRRVVSRPQPGSAPELVDADDALRARSANVLAGSAIVAAGYPAASLLTLMADTDSLDSVSSWGATSLVALLVTVVVGWLVAVRRSPVRSRPSASPRQTARGIAR